LLETVVVVVVVVIVVVVVFVGREHLTVTTPVAAKQF